MFDGVSLVLQVYDSAGRLVKAISSECSCNATTILGLLKRDTDFTAAVRGASGASGADGRTGAPGLTVSKHTSAHSCDNEKDVFDIHIFSLHCPFVTLKIRINFCLGSWRSII